ncbi:hypothetical protein RUS48_03440 [Mycoplasmoides gallisepticum]|nr:hypothetical protein RUS48_03440 [Mycoplasmoides gallisepticum]
MSDLDKNKQLKLIGIDLDGTLLSIRKKVTKKVIGSLLELRKNFPILWLQLSLDDHI